MPNFQHRPSLRLRHWETHTPSFSYSRIFSGYIAGWGTLGNVEKKKKKKKSIQVVLIERQQGPNSGNFFLWLKYLQSVEETVSGRSFHHKVGHRTHQKVSRASSTEVETYKASA